MKCASKTKIFFVIILVSLVVVLLYHRLAGKKPSGREKPLLAYHDPNITLVEGAPKTPSASVQPVTKPKKQLAVDQDGHSLDDLSLSYQPTHRPFISFLL